MTFISTEDFASACALAIVSECRKHPEWSADYKAGFKAGFGEMALRMLGYLEAQQDPAPLEVEVTLPQES